MHILHTMKARVERVAAHLPGALAFSYPSARGRRPDREHEIQRASPFNSVAQMPPGTPDATVGVDASIDTALLAARSLALSNCTLAGAVDRYQVRAGDSVPAPKADPG